MPRVKVKALRELEADALRDRLFQLRSELSKLSGKASRGMIQKQSGNVKGIKRNVARVLTVMTRRVSQNEESDRTDGLRGRLFATLSVGLKGRIVLESKQMIRSASTAGASWSRRGAPSSTIVDVAVAIPRSIGEAVICDEMLGRVEERLARGSGYEQRGARRDAAEARLRRPALPFHGGLKVRGRLLTGRVVSISNQADRRDPEGVPHEDGQVQPLREDGGASSTPTCLPASS